VVVPTEETVLVRLTDPCLGGRDPYRRGAGAPSFFCRASRSCSPSRDWSCWSRAGTICEPSFFPWLFLLFMVPIPNLVFNEITFPLQLLASKVAAATLPVLGVPVLREGNVIQLPAMALEVAEACSGIRSLMSLATLAVIYGYLLEPRNSIRVALALASVPIAVLANSSRIVGTGLLVQYWTRKKQKASFTHFQVGSSSWFRWSSSFFCIEHCR